MIYSVADWGIFDLLSIPLVARKMRRSGEFSISGIKLLFIIRINF
jgi:hypothetical protein